MTGKIKYPELIGKTRMQKQVKYNAVYRINNLQDEREKTRIRVQRYRDKQKILKIGLINKMYNRGYLEKPFAKDYYTLEELEGE